MALALQSPSSTLEDSLFGSFRDAPPGLQVDDGPLLFRHLPPEPDKRKVHAWTTAYQYKPLPAHKVAAGLGNFPSRVPAGVRVNRRRAAAHARQRYQADLEEGRELAADDESVRLPSDYTYRCPSLYRQGAFREGTAWASFAEDERHVDDNGDADTAELYRLGLLYDNEHERGSGFGLDKIVHRDPVPEYTVREAKRVKRSNGNTKADLALFWAQSTTPVLSPLSLSFNGLANDEAIARFLISPENDFDGDAATTSLSVDAAPAAGVCTSGAATTVEDPTSTMTSQTSTAGRTLTVIYEADEAAAEADLDSAAATQLPTAPTTPAAAAEGVTENDFPFESAVSAFAGSAVDAPHNRCVSDDDDDDDWDAVDETDNDDDDDLTAAQRDATSTDASNAAAAADAWVVVQGDDS